MFKKKYAIIYENLIKPFIGEQILSCIFLLLYTTTNVLFPYFLKLIIDDAIGANSINKLVTYVIMMITTIIIMLISKYLYSIKFLKLGQKVIINLKQIIVTKLLSYSLNFIRRYQNGEIVSIIENDVKKVEVLATYTISDFFVNVITGVSLFIILFKMNYIIALGSILLVFIYGYIQYIYGIKIKNKSYKLSKRMGKIYSFTQELVSNISNIKFLNCEIYFKDKYIKHLKTYFDKEICLGKMNVCSGLYGIIFQNLGILLVLCLGGYMVLKGNMTLGILFSLTIYIQKIHSPIISLSKLYIQIKKSQASLNRIFDLINDKEQIIKSGNILMNEFVNGIVEIKNLSFNYTDEILIKDTSILINNGDKLALMGNNGSGKTTFINLLLRMQEGYTGKITIDKYDIKEYDLKYFRENIVCIGQKPFIFSGSILDNIIINHETISKNIIDEILEFVCLKEDVDNMPKGIHTIIGESGVAVSGGQAQKIALARLYLMNKPIIILDEPTSALDRKSEEIICKNIYNKFTKNTIIAITHRTNILKYCSKAYEIKNNRMELVV